ncbi:DUF1654 domain-containing protein [Pseudomonas aeruginosa]|uniref:DUF1654 domain-containing protein n=1 Tax=Pseudomonas aeruginosa TaxID=287 RepID=UPI000449CBA4|nr:DUF1654 domain-containing protein [Pseudomonas aeruginosa]EJN1507743.1 DUF1654 domain-containing protein [Pseudomonas aeruginosa]ELH7254656.1 DUF1654 domain-containing protein [Pseudomonas aeruginosa]ELL4392594.1 DUF1654 domain-containing protein [Pseudomonas aeruginosa]EZO77599.1 hypothetical protein V558_01853 [Pseudomonas aeruginosa BWH057]EZO84778.1 hypothetical protein V557_01774 [Pseudomonas aeruginosa BWH056]
MVRKAASSRAPSPYELLALRIQKQLLTPRVQLERRSVISRMPDEPEDAWLHLLDELAQEDSLTITHHPDGSVELAWPHPATDW